jgi:hypothetical protein
VDPSSNTIAIDKHPELHPLNEEEKENNLVPKKYHGIQDGEKSLSTKNS